MDTESLQAKKHNNRAGLFVFLLFLVWLPTYLLFVRPPMNAWLAHYISSYPAFLHFIPILGPVVLIAWLLGKRYPSQSQVEQASEAKHG